MVAVRHWCGGGERKSTLTLLCEDGSLRMYAASNERTGYWLSSALQPVHAPRRRPRLLTHYKGKAQQLTAVTKSNSNGIQQFPVDFFEHCAMSDIEFGGNNLLQVYNTAQIKHRLNTTGDWSTLWKRDYQDDTERELNLCALLISVLWKLTACRNRTTGPLGKLSYELRHSEHTLHALADTIHAFQLHADSD